MMTPTKSVFLAVIIILSNFATKAQSSITSLKIPSKAIALGGYQLTAHDTDLNQTFENPAYINENIDKTWGLGYTNYLADISLASIATGYRFGKLGIFTGNLSYLSYGKFKQTNVYGEEIGSFTAYDAKLALGYGKSFHKNFKVGGNLNILYSDFFNSKMLELTIDVGGVYQSNSGNFQGAVVVRNLGKRVLDYNKDIKEKTQPKVHAGISQRITHAPFRLFLTYSNLEQWDLTYPGIADSSYKYNPLTGEMEEKKFTFDKLLRHLTAGVEFVPVKSFSLMFGYNHLRRMELKTPSRGGLAGFSTGIKLHLRRFDIGYNFAGYHLKGLTNSIYITAKFPTIFAKRVKSNNESKKN